MAVTIINAGAAAGASSSSNVATYSSGTPITFPAVGDVILVVVVLTGSVATDWVVTDNQGGTYTRVARTTWQTNTCIVEIHARNQLATSAVAHVITYSHASGNATGLAMHQYHVHGSAGEVFRTGAAIALQSATGTGIAATTPATTFPAAMTLKPLLSVLGNLSNPDAVSQPSGWGAGATRAFNTPTTGFHSVNNDVGLSTTTLTWGSTSATEWAAVSIEIDTSAPGTAWTKTKTDTIGATDPAQPQSAYARPFTEAIGTTDPAQPQVAYARPFTEVLGMLDSRGIGRSKIFAESVGLLDSDVIGRAKSPTDLIGMIDSQPRVTASVRSFTDVDGLLDSVSRAGATVRPRTDTTGILDSAAKVVAFLRSPTDLEGILDSVTHQSVAPSGKTVNDVIGLLDTAIRAEISVRSQIDTIGLLDSASHVAAALRSPTDLIGLLDSRGLARSRIFAENVGLLDSDVNAVTKALADAVGLLDSRSIARAKLPTDTVGLLDSRSLGRSKIIADNLGMLDTAVRLNAALRIVVDALPATDSVVHTGSGALVKTIADPLGILDSVLRAAAFSRTSPNPIGILDSAAKVAGSTRSRTDTIGLLDTTSRVWSAKRTAVDTIGVLDTAVKVGTYLRVALDQLGLTDVFVTEIIRITIIGPIEATLVRVTPITPLRQATPYATLLIVTARSGLVDVTPRAEMRRSLG